MPCLSHECFMEDPRKLSMCSTPLPTYDGYDNLSASSPYSNENLFDECYKKAEREIEELKRLSAFRKIYVQQLINSYEYESMLGKWEDLGGKTEELQKKCTIQRHIMELRKQLLDITTKVPSLSYHVEDKMQLEKNIQVVKAELDNVLDKKTLIMDYNFQAHRFVNDAKYTSPSLKDDINELYRIWEETHQKIQQQLTTLQQTLATWHNFEVHMLELKTVLREEQSNLNILDNALKQDVNVTTGIADSIKNITKYLSDKTHNVSVKANNNSVSDHEYSKDGRLNFMNIEGSFSDSGISDSGSEQDLSSSEKRLVLLKKLARHLESVLAPGSKALHNISKKIDEAEEEIRELQEIRRTLIRTANLEKIERDVSKKRKSFSDNFQKINQNKNNTKSADPESDPDKGRSVFWRVLRASLPFHMAIVVLLCVACLLEPNCCDAINNLNLSLSPQLRYVSGPPPT